MKALPPNPNPLHDYRLIGLLFPLLIFWVSGCTSVKSDLSKLVIMDYDQVNNFRTFYFTKTVQYYLWNGSPIESDAIYGYSTSKYGFWVTYFICSIRNENSKAQTFNFDMSKFYVEYAGKKFYYEPLKAYSITSKPDNLEVPPTGIDAINQQFRIDTQLGKELDTYEPNYYENVNKRFSIYVYTTKAEKDWSISKFLPLHYEGYPNLLNARNQDPIVKDEIHWKDLLDHCRPQNK